MGQYIQAGICYRIKVSKIEMERSKVSYEDIRKALSEEISIDLYEVKEAETGYIFSLQNKILETGNLPDFLMEQYKMLNVDKDRIENIMSNLQGLNKADDIIAFANEKRYQTFHYRSIYDNIYCTIWRERVMVEYEAIIFMSEGKILMECYRDFLKYLENLIKKNNTNIISKAVKAFIG